MKKILQQLMPCTRKSNRWWLLAALAAGIDPALAAINCSHLDGIWQGTLTDFSAVKLTIAPKTAQSKLGFIQFVDSRSQNRSYDVNEAACQVLSDKSVSVTFYRNRGGAEVNLKVYLAGNSDGKLLQVPLFSVRENRKYEKVSGTLSKG
ncbi:hypothetical protein Lrub_2662 [Legionella rubrilucens]|uniref:Uncharacterized protein n=1 Tax=Legionella rubrilucens TaxID=458 RepID=A0A0W0XMJ7_9GAMM|nr:hypothetical protein [Legionella rubrilucens]KTD45865.1 hypothetical protein Lrub_2662 [Legionella rubrilucens]